ncbi:MAG TPA: bifunctional diaminohydroxyphosphoribosylaminopyrimidine deaminase/5-amino-6-(5-phosphoribosylamino)uracil reductase RibD [Verrucomicrobiae bacterium]|nr:bifunctional diaminohydroxyphosphoribosylaminopyrimidine deaminase/5-amino-6-(5-phosphoribosylamino)uracil reductase RibD [Verrucomicrobiae bacterium]
MNDHRAIMREALKLARRGYGTASPNPMVGAVLVKAGKVIGRGWHRKAGLRHAEIEAILDARKRGHALPGATLYVTLEPCSTQGRTPPCTDAILESGIRQVVAGAADPNPKHQGRGLRLLRKAGVRVIDGVLREECAELNEAFNHWIVSGTPLVTVKAAMTLDGKIATASGESKWITGTRSRAFAMYLRRGADAILVGVNTILADNPSLTVRGGKPKRLRRVILDSAARTPLDSKALTDEFAGLTTVVVTRAAPAARVAKLRNRARVVVAPGKAGRIHLPWLLKQLGAENVTSLLVEGGGEVNASFIEQHLVHRVAFFYAPRIMGGSSSIPAVGGLGARNAQEILNLKNVQWRELGPDLLLTANVTPR